MWQHRHPPQASAVLTIALTNVLAMRRCRLDSRAAPAYDHSTRVLPRRFDVKRINRVEIDYVSVLFRWLHILPAMVAVGGAIFMRMALLPALSEVPDAQRATLHEAIRSRWSKWIMGAILLLLISGFYNFFTLTSRYKLPPAYHMLFGIKFLLALAIFTLASFLSGRTAIAQRMRQNARTWLNLNVALAVLLVCISGVMRNVTMNAPLKSATAPPAVTTSDR
jgi:uncharacterized membrane protein